MGYTHTWTPKAASDENWNKFLEAVKLLHANLPEHSESAGGYYSEYPIVIRDGEGLGEPEFSEEAVYFNGDGEGKEDLMHETFLIEKDYAGQWSSCKTARKPYDLLVCAVLLAASEHLDIETTKTDGTLEDWTPAIKFYIETLHSGNPLFLGAVLPKKFHKEDVNKLI